MTASAASSIDAAFALKGGNFTATLLELQSVDPETVARQLAARMTDAAAFLRHSPVVLSVEKVGMASADWGALIRVCREAGLTLVGVRAPDHLQSGLEALGLPVLAVPRRKSAVESTEPAAASVPAPVAAAASTTRVITQPVRGGQQVYAAGDLIVLAPVQAGAEVLADGHIHIYAPLRGRALAGVQGNAEARIFCQSLEAELISVAGRYRTAEELRKQPEWSQSVQVNLQGDALVLSRF